VEWAGSLVWQDTGTGEDGITVDVQDNVILAGCESPIPTHWPINRHLRSWTKSHPLPKPMAITRNVIASASPVGNRT